MNNQTKASPACQLNLPFDSLSSGKERGKLYRNRDWLYQKYWGEKLSIPEIAKICGKSDTPIYNNMIKLGIRRRTISEALLVLNKNSRRVLAYSRDYLYRKYWGDKLSASEISKLCDVHKSTIAAWMKKWNIKSRNHSEAGKLMARITWNYSDDVGTKLYHNKELLEELYLKADLNSVEIGELCGTKSNVIMRWLRRYKIEIKPKGENQRGRRTITKEHQKKMEEGRKRGVQRGTYPWIKKGEKRLSIVGENNPNYGGKYSNLPEIREKISKANKGRKIGKEEMEKRLKSWNRKPSGLEKFFDELTPKIVRYTGDGSWWRRLKDGHYHNPDFKITGQNKVIELFGDYWHRNDNPNKLINLYKRANLKALVIWENEVYNNKEGVMGRVNKFISS